MGGAAGLRIFETPLYPYERSPDQDAPAPARHPVVVVGAGPAGLPAAIDLARRDIPVVLLDENDRVSYGSRAICFAKHPLLDERYLGDAPGALYLLRPDQHVAARFTDYDPERIAAALRRASAQETRDP